MLIRRDDAGPERSNDLVLSNLGFSNSKDFSAMNHVQENLLWIGSIILKHLLEILTFFLKNHNNSSIFSQNKCTFICSSKVNKKDRFVSSFNRLHYEKHSSR